MVVTATITIHTEASEHIQQPIPLVTVPVLDEDRGPEVNEAMEEGRIHHTHGRGSNMTLLSSRKRIISMQLIII